MPFSLLKRILLTAGPTREPMDPVRYLTNSSSGKMGLALAAELQKKKFNPTVVLGPVPAVPARAPFEIVSVTTAREMHRAVFRRIRSSDVFISTAAVSDFRFDKVSAHKIKKGSKIKMAVSLVRNLDILKDVGTWKKKNKLKQPVLIGFALETKNVRRAMEQKLKEKNLDLIIGNQPASLGADHMRPLWMERGGRCQILPMMTKRALAKKITHWIKTHRS